jgi:hypothetical protein
VFGMSIASSYRCSSVHMLASCIAPSMMLALCVALLVACMLPYTAFMQHTALNYRIVSHQARLLSMMRL